MNDSIFLILSTNFAPWDPCENCRPLRIYENVEKNGIMKWIYFGDFGEREYDFFMLPAILAIENEKFIFFPHEVKPSVSNRTINMISCKPIELWRKNKTYYGILQT